MLIPAIDRERVVITVYSSLLLLSTWGLKALCNVTELWSLTRQHILLPLGQQTFCVLVKHTLSQCTRCSCGWHNDMYNSAFNKNSLFPNKNRIGSSISSRSSLLMVDTSFWFPNIGLSPILVKNQAELYVSCLPRKAISVSLYKEIIFHANMATNIPFKVTDHWSKNELPFNENNAFFLKKEKVSMGNIEPIGW